MKKSIIFTLTMAFSIGFTNAQSRFGLGFGGQALKFKHETIGEDVGASQFRSTTRNFDLGSRIYGTYTINDNLSYLFGVGFHTWNLGYQTIHGKNESHYGIYAYNYFTGISYYKNFSNSRFGYSIGAELTISEFSGGADYNGNVPEGSRLYYGLTTDSNGNEIDNSIYRHEFSKSTNGRNYQIFIRPELGLFYDVSPKGRIVLKASYGFNLHSDVLTLDYERIRYKGEFYQTKHRYSGDFISTLLAYEIKF